MKKVIANKKPNNQTFVKFEDFEDFLENIESVAWNGKCLYQIGPGSYDVQIKSYEGWTEFDPEKHYLSNSDVGCYYPVSVEYFEENYEIGVK